MTLTLRNGLSARIVLWLLPGVCALQAAETGASDWPMWRYDANRSAATPHELPSTLHLQWVRTYPPREQAWTAFP